MTESGGEIEWWRLLVRSGFYFSQQGGSFDFKDETIENRKYFALILSKLSLADYYQGEIFTPPKEKFSAADWLSVIEGSHIGCEGGNPGFLNIELRTMDAYLGGLVRWLSYVGVKSWHSCDGHGKEKPYIAMHNEQHSNITNNLLLRATSISVTIRNSKIMNCQNPKEIVCRETLLDIAEYLYINRDSIKSEVENEVFN